MWPKLAAFVFGERPRGRVPERVRELIAQQQLDAEKLIGWVQFNLAIFFIVLYAVSPKTSNFSINPAVATGDSFIAVPWALGLYFLFTVVRLVLTYRGTLPGWFLMFSVVADISLLMVLIWTFHLQYAQPAAFYLKAPTLLYVFIFISLRVLRFEPKYVITAGAAAALGWMTMLLYAIAAAKSGDDVITRNYVLYMTSNRVLIGAEIDKIISILVVMAVLAVAVVRAQRLLIRGMVDSTAAHDLSRFVARDVADKVTTADKAIQPGDGEMRVASVLFTDIEGFSTISEKVGPARLAKMLNDYFGAMSEVINECGGTISQFQGDAMLITFNTVEPHPDHAASAVRTAIGIQEACRDRTFAGGIPLKTRCGINTGEMLVGAVGSEDRMLFTVHGDEVNIAARLEQLNKQYGTYIMAGENTIKSCSEDFPFERMGEITVRGRSSPTEVYALKV